MATVLITGTRKGIGRFLAEHFLAAGDNVIGCSRKPAEIDAPNYRHHCIDIANEDQVRALFGEIRKENRGLDILINNAGIAAMNSALLMPASQVREILDTNVLGVFLFCREAAKLMKNQASGRIVNFTTAAVPFKLEGEAVHAASKAAVISLTEILAREFAEYGITVNAVGPTVTDTDLLSAVPRSKIDALIARQAIPRMGEFRDIANVVDFFIRPESDFVTGQVIFLGGV